MGTRILKIKQGVLDKNDRLAQNLRAKFQATDTFVINLVSAPGAGKTALLEKTLRMMKGKGLTVAALVGDLSTDNDARRLARSGAPIRQIETAGICHLEAAMIEAHLADWGLDLTVLDYLFIENVGNLVCPSSYDLGETLRVVLMAVTEGEDKPLKYPPLFSTAHLTLITKIDLAVAVEFNRKAAYTNIRAVNPGLPILETSAKTGHGLADWLAYLEKRRRPVRQKVFV